MQNKKILIITYYWPPAGGPGVQRWLKFCKYLPDFGFDTTIYTPENPSYPLVDETLLNDVLPNQKTLKTKIWEPYQLAEMFSKNTKKYKAGQFDISKNQTWKSKISLFIRGNFFIPDARKFWLKPSVKFLKNYLQSNPTDFIVSTGPPHSMHLIAMQLKKEFPQLKWIADFRDPWTEISYYKHLKLTKYADAKHKKLEKEVFTNADICLATSYTDADNFKKNGANAFCITNGFDGDIKNVSTKKTENFCISYIGVLEQLRNPNVLWKALQELSNENKDFSEEFSLRFVGKIDDKIKESLLGYNFSKNCTFIDYLPHKKAILEMENSNILLICNFPNIASKGIIPGKLFEYLMVQKPIISIGPRESDVQIILDKTQSGKHFSDENLKELKSYILEKFLLWQSNSQTNLTSNIEDFHRKNLTKNLVDLL